ncbi:ABC-type transport system substrate-binding protein [Crossiella equi]|uniref:ABC-type transport system substrate-binding protein n=1 Tax=Crossiella equi TaxID=130796 RepID=A0ABS5AJ74_9PSEU|nr:ABC transporter family substrate-binding protein [Crossiella equi]MBP2476436.1 ABC-type transport system substrate-binding protein [Crossiella equi]
MGSAATTTRLASVLLGLGLLAACTTAPPPPLVTSGQQGVPTKVIDINEILVGVDRLTRGFNPHTLADQSPVTTALASLILPSAFRTGPDGVPRPDPALLNSAQVTKSEPFTVTYSLRKDASWSDGGPIAAEDFDYLWRQMNTQPGTVNPAGYRLISNVVSRDSGKTVEVVFSKPYPGWRSLFRNLLPAHLLKDAFGGWNAVADQSFPASGGRFTIRQLDLARGEVTLERNDRYWGTPATLGRIVIRRADTEGLTSALRSGNNQLALLTPDQVTYDALRALSPAPPLTTLPRGSTVQLLLRPVSPVLADVRMRTALVSYLDRNALIASATGNGPSAGLRADAQLFAPGQPGYAPTMPPDTPSARPDPGRADALLRELGYQRDEAGKWKREGVPLGITIGAPTDREPYASLANQIRRVLAEAGVDARVTSTGGDQLFGELLPSTAPTGTSTTTTTTTGPTSTTGVPATDTGVVDLAVVPQVVDGDPATVLASSFGCPVRQGDNPPGPGNPAGFCDRTLQPVIDSALTGAAPLSQVLPGIETTLWQQVVAVPLYEPADVLVSGPDVSGVDPGPLFAGPFSSAHLWKRSLPK